MVPADLFTQVASLPREAGVLQTCMTTCFHKMDAHICMLPRGETESQSGEERLSAWANQCWKQEGQAGVRTPHWPLWLPGCLCLVRPALDRDKAFGLFTSGHWNSFPIYHSKLKLKLSDCLWWGLGHWLLTTPVSEALPAEWQGRGLPILENIVTCLNDVPLALPHPINIVFLVPSPISPEKQTLMENLGNTAHSFLCLF